ncbi:SIR2 family NAD-dependent protein deacylase [Solibacillus daqui]|uniref:SIR2 family NAD-dependent protein deacylase n=1 Tax=Solibacillus daqui TaxID=2912187 RepID=UPI0023665535|nr:NAD-dependent deacylase [Solibacillus daqui]
MIQTVASWLKHSASTVILTGAGMSTESGIPDFRSKAGWWKSVDPRTVASVESLTQNYELFREFYQLRIKALEQVKPHKGHEILAEWEQQGLVGFVATQNVDRLHQLAGNKQVAELHGNILTIRCEKCEKPHSKEHFMNNAVCTYCMHHLRPNVVLFGESLPQEAWNRTLNEIQQADIIFVIGTSLEVYPVNQLPMMAQGKLVYINLEVESQTQGFDAIIQGTAGEVLAQIDVLLNR